MTAAGRFRAHARRKVRLPGLLVSPRSGWQRPVEITDLALGGACVRLVEAPRAGEWVTLAIVSPALWDPLAMPGRIAWAGTANRGEAAMVGMGFEPTDARLMLALYELMKGLEELA